MLQMNHWIHLSLPAATCVCPLNRWFILAHLAESSSSDLLYLNLAFSAPPWLFPALETLHWAQRDTPLATVIICCVKTK